MNIKSKIESLLFISAKPMAGKQLAELMKVDLKDITQAGADLVEEYKNNGKGIQIIQNGGKLQMVSAPENAGLVAEFIKDESSGELSRPSLEALTIIAYRGPISKTDLDRIRGVNCSLIVRNLLIRGLIEAKADQKKQETYYTVTMDFIRFLGINDISELPDYARLHQDDAIDRVLAEAEGILNAGAGNGIESGALDDDQTESDDLEDSSDKGDQDEAADDAGLSEITEEAGNEELDLTEDDEFDEDEDESEDDEDEFEDEEDNDEEEILGIDASESEEQEVRTSEA